MRILIVNPNTTGSMTEKIGEAGRAVASRGTEVTAVNPAMGPESIEGYYDEAFSVPGLLEEIRRGEGLGFDGYVIACFDDTGLDAARTLATGPVLGICEAAMHAATMLGGRFSIVTTLARSVPALEGLARRYGVADRCRVRASDVPVLALEDPSSGAAGKVEDEIRRAVREDGAECIVLGCAGMANLASELSCRLGLPVIDGVAAATRMIEALVGLGLKTSKIGGYAAPLPKAYSGEFRRFAPAPPGANTNAGRLPSGRTVVGQAMVDRGRASPEAGGVGATAAGAKAFRDRSARRIESGSEEADAMNLGPLIMQWLDELVKCSEDPAVRFAKVRRGASGRVTKSVVRLIASRLPPDFDRAQIYVPGAHRKGRYPAP